MESKCLHKKESERDLTTDLEDSIKVGKKWICRCYAAGLNDQRMAQEPRFARNVALEAGKIKEEILPLRVLMECSPANTSISDSNLQNSKRMNVCCFKLPGLW